MLLLKMISMECFDRLIEMIGIATNRIQLYWTTDDCYDCVPQFINISLPSNHTTHYFKIDSTYAYEFVFRNDNDDDLVRN
jgi:molybdenum cofactor biosynthesis enzyme MoaA